MFVPPDHIWHSSTDGYVVEFLSHHIVKFKLAFFFFESKFIVLEGHGPYAGQPYHVSGGRLPAI